MMKQRFFLGLSVGLSALVAAAASPRPLDIYVRTIPAVVADDADQARFFDELKGKATFIDFWAVWCAPCVASMPHVEAIKARFQDRADMAVISVHVGPTRDGYSGARAFLRRHGHENLTVSVDETLGVFGQFADRQTVRLPRYIVLGPDGRVIWRDDKLNAKKAAKAGDKMEKAMAKYQPPPEQLAPAVNPNAPIILDAPPVDAPALDAPGPVDDIERPPERIGLAGEPRPAGRR